MMFATEQSDRKACSETAAQHIERTREIISAASELLDTDELCAVPSDGDLGASDRSLTATRQALVQRLTQSAGDPQARLSSLVLDSAATQASVKDALIQHRADSAIGVSTAISALRNATSMSALADRAPVEAQRIGFRRALFSRIEKGTWMTRSAFAVDDPAFGDELVAIGRANPRLLNGPLVESEMVRRCTPMVIPDAQSNPRVHLQLVQYTNTTSYVAAPVLAWGVPVAMMHADRHTDGAVDELDRYVLSTYTEGLGLAIERTQLMERLQAVRRATSDYLAGVSAIADDFTADALSEAEVGLAAEGEGASAPIPPLCGDRGERLTPREWDVLRNMASGKTNAQIATGLFVTEGTVKSHVKHILRKLGATNRTEAVARYHRLTANSGAKAG